MVTRALLGQRGNAYGLWISKPGQDVETAAPQDLSFNSDWSAFGYLIQGTHTVNWGGSNTGSYDQFINFGQTFPRPPLVIFDHLVGGVYRTFDGASSFSYSKRVRIRSPEGWLLNTAFYELWTDVQANRIRVRGNWDRANRSGVQIPNITFRYTVLNYNF